MSQFKRCKVVMLPTNEKAPILKSDNGIVHSGHFYVTNLCKDESYQNLYITSDDKIKEGDWLLPSQKDMFDRVIPYQYINGNGGINDKKIIATTDTSLILYNESDFIKNSPTVILLPQPSQAFIEKYVEEYNKGNIITDVLVEYEEFTRELDQEEYLMARSMGINNFVVNPTLRLKTNPKNNTITIKKVKDSWSREEVIRLIEKHTEDMFKQKITLDKWIEENL